MRYLVRPVAVHVLSYKSILFYVLLASGHQAIQDRSRRAAAAFHTWPPEGRILLTKPTKECPYNVCVLLGRLGTLAWSHHSLLSASRGHQTPDLIARIKEPWYHLTSYWL